MMSSVDYSVKVFLAAILDCIQTYYNLSIEISFNLDVGHENV